VIKVTLLCHFRVVPQPSGSNTAEIAVSSATTEFFLAKVYSSPFLQKTANIQKAGDRWSNPEAGLGGFPC
jgi:hypothetical protein